MKHETVFTPEATGFGSGPRQNHHFRWGSAALNFYRWVKIERDGQISNGTVTETVKDETGMGQSDPEEVEIFGAGDGI